MMGNVRTWLAEPMPNQPSQRLVLNAVKRQTQSMFNQLSNNGQAWDIGDTTLYVTSGQREYQLNVDESFGKPLRVTSEFPGQPSHIPRDIDFFDLQDINYNWQVPDNMAAFMSAPDGSNCTAQRISFYRREGVADNVYVQVSPVPMAPAQYLVLYTLGNWIAGSSLTDSPVLTEHHQLIEVKAALSLLAATRWYDDDKQNETLRGNLARSLVNDRDQFQSDFDSYIRSMTNGKMRSMAGYGTFS